jgi:hypothetical protein
MDWLKLAIRKCRSFWRLDGDDRWLLLQSFLLLLLVAISLKFWGFKRSQAALAKLLEKKKPGFCENFSGLTHCPLNPPNLGDFLSTPQIWGVRGAKPTKLRKSYFGNNSEIREKKPGFSTQKIIKTTRMVQLAARYCQPWANCLKKSLVLWGLLRRQGIESELRIGVQKEAGNFAAHAWVEYDGFVLNDTQDVRDRFSMFDGA